MLGFCSVERRTPTGVTEFGAAKFIESEELTSKAGVSGVDREDTSRERVGAPVAHCIIVAALTWTRSLAEPSSTRSGYPPQKFTSLAATNAPRGSG